MEFSPRLALSYVAPNQAQKHVTVNESFRRLDALVQMRVLSRTETTEPASPTEGDAYILPAGASGTYWDGFDEHDVAAFQDGAWAQIAPAEGFCAWVADDDEFVAFDGAAWDLVSGGAVESAAKFGINATADATNKLSVKSDAILFSHDDVTPGSGDAQVKVNKASASDVATHLFQTNFSGRAEFGLAGDDDFRIKVSADGSAWTDALFIDKDNGYVGVKTTSPAQPLSVNGDIYARNIRTIDTGDVADDATVSVTPPFTGGVVVILTFAGASFPQAAHSGVIFYDVASSVDAAKWCGGSVLDAATGDLTGTTGVDGRTTVSAKSNEIEIENRSGSTRNYRVIFLG